MTHMLVKAYNGNWRLRVPGGFNYWLTSIVPMNTKPKTATFCQYMSDVHLIPAIGQIQLQLQKLSQDALIMARA